MLLFHKERFACLFMCSNSKQNVQLGVRKEHKNLLECASIVDVSQKRIEFSQDGDVRDGAVYENRSYAVG